MKNTLILSILIMMASCGSKHISTEKVNDESKMDS